MDETIRGLHEEFNEAEQRHGGHRRRRRGVLRAGEWRLAGVQFSPPAEG
jgi:hypothetical protein